MPFRNRLRVSPALIALVAGNLLLLCLVLLLLAREGRLDGLFAPAPPEVAKPNFEPTDAPAESGDPFPLPTGAAPALAPSVTPQPTYTPQAIPANWKAPAVINPQLPANGVTFVGPDATVILAWDSAGQLPQDVFYVADIRKLVGGKLKGESHNWTKSNRIRLDSSFYTALNDRGVRGLAAPELQTHAATFEWSVALYRLTTVKPDGTMEGNPLTMPSKVMTFIWAPSAPTPAPPIYGRHGLNIDPFFEEQQHREASVTGALSPISMVMAGLFLLVGFVAARGRKGN